MTKLALVALFLSVTAVASAQTFTTMSFEGNTGADPVAALIQGLDGAIYGTTKTGGDRTTCCGVIFKITADGPGSVLRLTPVDGIVPQGALLLASNGRIYGTTTQDGENGNGQGDIFELAGGNTPSVLYTFCLQLSCTDGSSPEAGLVEGADDDLYGTTTWGGANLTGCGGIGCGTIFKVSLSGKLTTLYSFCSQSNCTDGAAPGAALIQGTDGNLYGTAFNAGANVAGTVFTVSPAGRFETIYSFCGQPLCGDGNGPVGALVQANDGNLYGVTLGGGATNNGTAFRIISTGELTTIHDFCQVPGCPDGSEPESLIQASDGNFYGVTRSGGTYGWGTAFEMSRNGTVTTLHNFSDSDGGAPIGGLLQATTGIFYGTTSMGGDLNCDRGAGCGTVFSLDTGLGPFVTFVLKAGKVGNVAEILGQGFTGATSVSFAGAPADFTVRSDTFLTATVPVGATTGFFVTVDTPSGTLTSNVPFQVVP